MNVKVIFLKKIIYVGGWLLYNIVMVFFATRQYETAIGTHTYPLYLASPLTSYPTLSLQVVTEPPL